MDRKIGIVLEILTDAAIAIGVACMFLLPGMIRKIVPEHIDYVALIYVFMYVIALLSFWFLFELRATTVSVRRGNPFTVKTVRNLLRMGIACGAISTILLIAAVLSPDYIVNIAAGFLCLTSLLASLSAFVCSFLFKRAVKYREDNELTI